MEQLVKDLLLINRYEHDQIKHNTDRVCLNELLTDCIVQTLNIANLKNQKIEHKRPRDSLYNIRTLLSLEPAVRETAQLLMSFQEKNKTSPTAKELLENSNISEEHLRRNLRVLLGRGLVIPILGDKDNTTKYNAPLFDS